MTTEQSDKPVKSERENINFNARINSRCNRDFERHGVYTPRSLNIQYGGESQTNQGIAPANNFRFKNSLVITPYYEIEFNAVGGIKYIKNHEDRVFFTNDGIFAMTNNTRKIPVLLKRSINKQAVQKKLIVEERYNYEEKYEIFKNIILYYDENRIDFQILFNKNNSENNANIKDITTEFSLNLSLPGISGDDDTVTYKKYGAKQEYKSTLSGFSKDHTDYDHPEYILVGCGRKNGGSYMTVYPDRRLTTEYKNQSLNFTAQNISQPQKNYINLKIYLENYRIT